MSIEQAEIIRRRVPRVAAGTSTGRHGAGLRALRGYCRSLTAAAA